jgi:hypothetical protein
MSNRSNGLLFPVGEPFSVPARKRFVAADGFAINLHNKPDKLLSICGYSEHFRSRVRDKVVEKNLPQVTMQLFRVLPRPKPRIEVGFYNQRNIDNALVRELRVPFTSLYAFLAACKHRYRYEQENRRYSTLTGFISDSSTSYVVEAVWQQNDNRCALSERSFNSYFSDNVMQGNEIIAPAQELID